MEGNANMQTRIHYGLDRGRAARCAQIANPEVQESWQVPSTGYLRHPHPHPEDALQWQ